MQQRIIRRGSSLDRGTLFGRRRRTMRDYQFMFIGAVIAVGAMLVALAPTIRPQVLAAIGDAPTATPSVLVLAQRGQAAYLAGDLDAALISYTAAAEDDPSNVGVVYELIRMLIYRSYGDVRFAQTDIPEAQKWAERLISLQPNDTRANTIACAALVRAGSGDKTTEDAVRYCIRALDIDPDNYEAHAFLSMAQYDLGRFATALEEAQVAVKGNPNSIDANLAMARAYVFAGRSDTALEYFRRAAAVNPNIDFPYFEMASLARTMALAREDDSLFALAIAAYRQVLSRNNRNVKAYTRICEALLAKSAREQEDIRQARVNCETAIEIDPNYSPGWSRLGEVRHKSRDYEGAIESLRKCVALEKDLRPELRDARCWWLQAAGLFILGKARCDEAVELATDVLGWASADPVTFRQANEVINKCASAYEGNYKTPTPVPTATLPPAPIF